MVGTLDDKSPFDIPTEAISFQRSESYCVCFVDMVDSTRVSLELNDPTMIRSYYSIFLNVTAAIAIRFGAKLVKNAGDSLIFYFPKTINPSDREAFKDMLECCSTIIASRDLINIKLHSERIEKSMNFRISADYGLVQVACSMSSRNEDLFGPTMSICAKINSRAEANNMAVGGDLYSILKRLSFNSDYGFKEIACYSADDKHRYPVYHVNRKTSISRDLMIKFFDNLQTRTAPAKATGHDKRFMHYTSPVNPEKRSQKKNINIMLVDDEADVLLTYKSFLSSAGYNVEVFEDPQEALGYFAKSNSEYYDLVILDIRMPNINGFQLYQRLKAINKDIRILFVSALEIAEELSTLMPEIKNNEILRKPVSKDALLENVNRKLVKELA